LYIYQDGCPYCAKLLRDNFGQQQITLKTQQHFDVIALNLWGDREIIDQHGKTVLEKQFAKNLKVQYTPTLLFLDEVGEVVIRINGYFFPHKFETVLDFVAGKLEKTMKFRAYYASHNTPPSSGKLHPNALFQKTIPQNSQKPLLVLFEQKQCRLCDELHRDIFQRPDTQKYLQQFDIVQFDMWSNEKIKTPSGQKTTIQKWANQLQINHAPTLILFDEKGKQVVRSGAFLKSFHIQSILQYVLTKSYVTQPEFQRYIQSRADQLEAKGIHVDIMK
jgi:thioredoxin-related protein